MSATYLGDGLYAEPTEDGLLRVYTERHDEHGRGTVHEVYFGPRELAELLLVAQRIGPSFVRAIESAMPKRGAA